MIPDRRLFQALIGLSLDNHNLTNLMGDFKMPDNYDFIQSCLDQFEFITVNGKALNLDLNEYRDENGQIVYVPIEFRSLFKTVELSE